MISISLSGPPAAGTFRILTFNAEGGGRLAFDLPILLQEQQPDIVTFQECGDKLWDVLEAQKGWYTKHYQQPGLLHWRSHHYLE